MDTDKEAIYLKRMMEATENGDSEIAHSNADDILCEMLEELGYSVIVETYHKVSKWYA